ncbi:MAG TPA: trehalase family glycosidase [Candidatus Limnocylindria bacterium]|nr:trehalase family glycosidase [Candidatus Limnocylindria bacterium]
MLTNYQDVTGYIHDYWGQVAFAPGKRPEAGWRNKIMQLGYVPLPNTAMAPNGHYFTGTQFYWDTYFTLLGLVSDGYSAVARGMVDNLCYLYDKFGLVPARNSTTSRGRTQPPYLTRMAWEIYEHEGADDAWLGTVMQIAQKEYEEVWCGKRRYLPELGLSRYNPKHGSRFLSVYESGWDRSTRFAFSPQTLVPVDLNAQLYVYEEDILNWMIQHEPVRQQLWRERLDKRRTLITQYFWDDQTGFFYDYDFKAGQRRPLKTLAGFYPLWAGAATAEQAQRCVQQLQYFEQAFGLASTEPLEWHKRQWDYPNGWAPLQYIVISGLRRYGFNEEAVRLANLWLGLNQEVFKQTGVLWEKYDVVKGGVGLPGRYPTQPGFSWTCGVFMRLLADLEDL